MIVYDYKLKSLRTIPPEEYHFAKHQTLDNMSSRQRQIVINAYIKIAPDLACYINNSTTNRVKLLQEATHLMVKGELPLNVVVLMVLLQDVHWEMRWRTH